MGAWGHGPFDNDMAMDFVADLMDETAPSRVRWRIEGALSEVLGDKVDADGACRAFAAAALLAARFDASLLADLDRDWRVDAPVSDLVALSVFDPNEERTRVALTALHRLVDPIDNSWYEPWEESGWLDEVLAHVRRVVALLERGAG